MSTSDTATPLRIAYDAAVATRAAAERAMDANPCEATGNAYLAACQAAATAEQAYLASMPRAPRKPGYGPRRSFAAACASWRNR